MTQIGAVVCYWVDTVIYKDFLNNHISPLIFGLEHLDME